MNAPSNSTASLGFTLIELVTTIVIVGILSAAALPRMFDNNAFSERGYIDEMASALRYAQKIALASRCEVSVTINAGGYSAAQRSSLNNCILKAGAWTTPVRRSNGDPLSGTTPSDVALATPAAIIIFDEFGVVSNGYPAAISVGPFTLTVDQSSGLVSVVP